MSKPILSELEYNASDVASAILSTADLQITNDFFAVTDRSSIFTIDSSWTKNSCIAYSFNGFMFVNWYVWKSSTPSNGEQFGTITDSDFRPSVTVSIPVIGHEGDTSEHVTINSSGEIEVHSAENVGNSAWYCVANFWYRF